MRGTEDMTPEECLDWIVQTYVGDAREGSPAHNRIEKVRAAIKSETQILSTLIFLKVWIEHWEKDRLYNLKPTQNSLARALTEVDKAINLFKKCDDK